MPTVPRTAIRQPPRRRRRWPAFALILVGVIVGMFFAFWRALRYEPDFYREALAVPAYREAEQSEALEQHVETLRQRVQSDERWEQVFTEEELNSWLAVELPRFPQRWLPPGMTDPRVVIDEQRVRVAAKYESGGVVAVVSAEIELAPEREPNTLGLRLKRARVGAVPAPLDRWIEPASAAARKSELPVRVESVDGTPVVYVTVPGESSAWPDRRLVLDRVELSRGRITLGGRSERK